MHSGARIIFSINSVKETGYPREKENPLTYTIQKSQLKRITDLNVRPETIKLKQNMEGKLLDISNDILDLTPK